ncbi:MAG TPA: ArsC/Spx/MgsR family protein [Candidatus Caenarcaniphilales bacterium]|nr:ArsC/Spx/MgsR family protein [Candidatus Caenarcaniphilales bacterium]
MAGWSGDARATVAPRPAPRQLRPGGRNLTVQVFGRKDSRATQKALRFFSDRRIPVSFIDVAARPPAPAELRRFVERHGAERLIDRNSRPYRDGGLAYMRLGEAEIVERLLADPTLIRLPLVRAGIRLSVGDDEAAWRSWLPGLREPAAR